MEFFRGITTFATRWHQTCLHIAAHKRLYRENFKLLPKEIRDTAVNPVGDLITTLFVSPILEELLKSYSYFFVLLISAWESTRNPENIPRELAFRLLLHSLFPSCINPLACHWAYNSALTWTSPVDNCFENAAMDIVVLTGVFQTVLAPPVWKYDEEKAWFKGPSRYVASWAQIGFCTALGLATPLLRETLCFPLPDFKEIYNIPRISDRDLLGDQVITECLASFPVGLFSKFVEFVTKIFQTVKTYAIDIRTVDLEIQEAILETDIRLDQIYEPEFEPVFYEPEAPPVPITINYEIENYEIPVTYEPEVPVMETLTPQEMIDSSFFTPPNEILNQLLEVPKGILRYLMSWSTTIKFTAAIGILVLIVWGLMKVFRKKRYIRYDDNNAATPGHRPYRAPVMRPGTNFPDFHWSFPVHNQDKAEELLENLNTMSVRRLTLPNELCPDCNCVLAFCQCAIPAQHHIASLNALDNDIQNVERQLENLWRPKVCATFPVGQVFPLKTRASFLTEWLEYLGLEPSVDLAVVDLIQTGDNRPEIEKHIRAGNARFLIFEQRPFLTIPYWFQTYYRIDLHPSILTYFGHPCRDLVVSEDLLRNTRRGCLTDQFDATLRGQLENTLSVPINDPAFIILEAHPVKDTFFAGRALHHGECKPYSDF